MTIAEALTLRYSPGRIYTPNDIYDDKEWLSQLPIILGDKYEISAFDIPHINDLIYPIYSSSSFPYLIETTTSFTTPRFILKKIIRKKKRIVINLSGDIGSAEIRKAFERFQQEHYHISCEKPILEEYEVDN